VLKGIGEHVFSMWVNITDSLLSVFLVWLLIPKMGIMGYAVVIVIMEGYNFALSFLRLRNKIKFYIRPIDSVVLPLFASVIALIITKTVFCFEGSSVSFFWIALKIIFALAIIVFVLSIITLIKQTKNMFLSRKTAQEH
jgi:O-antigen/teichoic acid export membrane protein